MKIQTYMEDFSVLSHFKMKRYDLHVKINEDHLPLGVILGLPSYQIQCVNEVYEDDLSLGLIRALPCY